MGSGYEIEAHKIWESYRLAILKAQADYQKRMHRLKKRLNRKGKANG